MKIDDLDYLTPITVDNSIILNGGVSAAASSSSLSEAWPDGAISSTNTLASATAKNTYTLAGAQVRTLILKNGVHLTFGYSKALAYASK